MKTSIKTNVETKEGGIQNEICHWKNYRIGVTLQSWFWAQGKLLAW